MSNTDSSNNKASRQIPIVCPGHTRPLAEVQFCSISPSLDQPEPRTLLLLSACHDKNPMLRNGITGDWIGTFQGHKGAVWSAKLDPMAYLAATASGDFSVKVWDAITGTCVQTFVQKHVVKTVDWSQNSRYLATGGHEGLLRVYDLVNPQQDPIIIRQGADDEKIIITKCCWIHDNQIVLVATSDGKLRFWSVFQSKLFLTLEVLGDVRDIEYSPKLQVLTVASGDIVSFFRIHIQDNDVDPSRTSLVQGKLLHAHKMPIHFRDEGGASLHPLGKKFIAGGSDLWVRVFDFETGSEIECHKGHHGPIRCLRYSPDGDIYASGSEDGTIRLWKTDVQ